MSNQTYHSNSLRKIDIRHLDREEDCLLVV